MTYCDECKARLYPDNPEVAGYDRRSKRYLTPICDGCSHQGDKLIETLQDRVNNLEAISAQPGEVPREYHESLQQLRGQVTFLQNKLNTALDRGKQKAKQRAEKAEKTTYGGLSA